MYETLLQSLSRNWTVLLVARRGTLLMETRLLHDFLGIFPRETKYFDYFCVEGNMQGEIEPTRGEIEMNLGNRGAGGGD